MSKSVVPLRERHACSIDEAVAYSGRGRTQFYDLLKRDEIRSVKSGRRRLVLVSSLVDWCNRIDLGATDPAKIGDGE
jgi:hypothetical protein